MPTDKVPSSSGARSAILAAIRSANSAAANSGATDTREVEVAYAQIPRTYVQHTALSREDIIALFAERLIDYNAHVVSCATDQIPSAIRAALEHEKAQRILIPADFPSDLLPPGLDITADQILSPAELDRFDATITLCTLAIAETGTLVLQGLAGQGRRAATLVPDVHICILRADDVVATVPEAFARLEPSSIQPLTFISGPSATADIEMTRIKGVHGPRFLHVLLVSNAPTSPTHEIL